jgi:hypothetical protein
MYLRRHAAVLLYMYPNSSNQRASQHRTVSGELTSDWEDENQSVWISSELQSAVGNM